MKTTTATKPKKCCTYSNECNQPKQKKPIGIIADWFFLFFCIKLRYFFFLLRFSLFFNILDLLLDAFE